MTRLSKQWAKHKELTGEHILIGEVTIWWPKDRALRNGFSSSVAAFSSFCAGDGEVKSASANDLSYWPGGH
uniref:Transposase n=1 Tax=Panagrellus redivivus TaxID=6233 RepID=A0A7E4VJC0_PANRE